MAPRKSAEAGSPDVHVADRVLVLTRTFDAPVELVWACWTDSEHGKQWGPAGFTMLETGGDLRVGGAWRARMRHDSDGTELRQGGVYREIVPHERLVFTFAWEGEDGRPGHETLVTLTFAEKNGRTTMAFRQEVFRSVEERDGHGEGWTEAFDRMVAHVESVAAKSVH